MIEEEIKCMNCKEEFDWREIEVIEMPNKKFELCSTCAVQMEEIMGDAICVTAEVEERL